MTLQELLRAWRGGEPTSAEIVRSPGLGVPLTWGRHESVLRFGRPVSGIVFGALVRYGESELYLGITKTAETTELGAMGSSYGSVADEVLLSVFEAGFQHTLSCLGGGLSSSSYKVERIVPIDDEIWSKAVPFQLTTVEKGALIASGLMVIPEEMVSLWGRLENVSGNDMSLVDELSCAGVCVLCEFPLDGEVEVGDYVLLPELQGVGYPRPVRVFLSNGLELSGHQSESGEVVLSSLAGFGTMASDKSAIVYGELQVSYGDVLPLVTGEGETGRQLPVHQDLCLWSGGKRHGGGHLTTLGGMASFEVESLVSGAEG